MRAEIHHTPHNDGGDEDDRTCFGEIIFHFFPHIDGNRVCVWCFVLRKFNEQGMFCLTAIEPGDDKGCRDGDYNTQQIHGVTDQHPVFSEKHGRKQDVDRKSRTT